MHDKKSDYYTGATHYEDMDGQLKNFTYVDHDVKTSIGGPIFKKEEKKEERKVSEDEQLCLDIIEARINEDERFIEFYDGKLAKKWGFERYRKGDSVQFACMYSPYYGSKYFDDLRKMYKLLLT